MGRCLSPQGGNAGAILELRRKVRLPWDWRVAPAKGALASGTGIAGLR